MVIKLNRLADHEASNSTHILPILPQRILSRLILLAVLLPSVVCGAETSLSDLLSTYEIAISRAINKAVVLKAPIAAPLKKIHSEIVKLENSFNNGQVTSSDSLATGIGIAAEAAEKISNDVLAPGTETMVGELLEDLEIKNEEIEGVANAWLTSHNFDVKVRINAIKDNVKQEGFMVKLIPAGYSRAQEPSHPYLSSPTSNAVDTVTPGKYWVYLSKDGKPPVSEHKRIKKANANEQGEVIIDVTVK